MKKVLALLLAVCLVISLCACEMKLPFSLGKKEPEPEATSTPKLVDEPEPTEEVDPNLGKYFLLACAVDGVFISPEGLLQEELGLEPESEITIELKKNGRAVLVSDGEKTNGKFVIDDDEICITAEDEDIYGTIGDGLIRLEADDVDLVFAKEDADISDLEILSLQEYIDRMGGSDPTVSSGSGTVTEGEGEGFHLKVLGVEPFQDWDNKDAIRIYYEFTNLSDESTSASTPLLIEAYQDNCALDYTYGSGTELDDNDYLNLRPGVTVRCIREYNYDPQGGVIRFLMKDWWNSTNVIDINLDPGKLPAPPSGSWSPELIDDPTWTDELYWEGDVGDFYVNVDSAALTEDYSGNDYIRVFYYLTNNSDEECYPYDLMFTIYQDGVELFTGWVDDGAESDDAMYDPIAPGKTVLVSTVNLLRSDSPIEVEVGEYWGDNAAVGGVFS